MRESTRSAQAVRAVLLGAIRGYQIVVSPWLGAHCRHMPSCSAYARAAIRRFGARRGGALAIRRVLRCHPWGTAGYDPVPDARKADSRRASIEP